MCSNENNMNNFRSIPSGFCNKIENQILRMVEISNTSPWFGGEGGGGGLNFWEKFWGGG